MSDEKFYLLIADELEQAKTDRVLWTRAMGESGGDSDKTKACYIRLRLAALKAAESSAAPDLQLVDQASPISATAKSADNRLLILRGELAEELQLSKTSSFYSVLGIAPEATDAAIAAAISSYEAKVDSGAAPSSPEFKYAKDTLGNARARETYDRRLFARLTAESTPASRNRSGSQERNAESDSVSLTLWETRKTSVIVGTLAVVLIGYLVLGFYKEREASAARKKAIDAQVIETNKAAEIAATRAESERALVDGVVKNSGTQINSAAQLGNRSLDIQQDAENRRRQELEYRANAGSQILDMQRQQQDRQQAIREQQQRESRQRTEDDRIARDKRYWACMNAALDRMDSATAGARCSGYR